MSEQERIEESIEEWARRLGLTVDSIRASATETLDNFENNPIPTNAIVQTLSNPPPAEPTPSPATVPAKKAGANPLQCVNKKCRLAFKTMDGIREHYEFTRHGGWYGKGTQLGHHL